jgi:hypothetical protein
MNKFARNTLFFVLYFVLFFVIINFLYLLIIASTDWDFKKRLEALNFNDPDFELLVLGNSFPEYGIDTELLTRYGIKSYNLAIVGNSDETCYVQLNEYLTKYPKKPKYVLLGVSSYTDPFYNQGIQPIVNFTMKGHIYSLNDIPISKFRWLGVEVLKKIVSSTYRNVDVVYGQIKHPKIIPDNTDYKESYLDTRKFESAQWIGEIVKLCSNNGIEVIIIEMPGVTETQNLSGFGPYNLSFENGSTANLYNYNSRDFCKILDPEKDWGGMSHLNQFGAVKLTEELLKIINTTDLSDFKGAF